MYPPLLQLIPQQRLRHSINPQPMLAMVEAHDDPDTAGR